MTGSGSFLFTVWNTAVETKLVTLSYVSHTHLKTKRTVVFAVVLGERDPCITLAHI